MSDKVDVKKISKTIGFPTFLLILQIIFIILMGIFAKYKFVPGSEEVPGIYSMFMDVHSMMFVGFGFLMTFLKKYGYGSVGFNFLVAAFVLEWALLVRGWFHSVEEGVGDGKFEINIKSLLVADFCAAAVLISFGAVIGKASIAQLIVMSLIEVVVQTVNEYIGLHHLKAYDVGESIYVHMFGAYFGLAVAKMLNFKGAESHKEGSIYHSDFFAMIGTIFLWLYWPSFNSATAAEEGQIRAIVNTYLSITASCITAFIISTYVGKGKLNMVHIQNATLAGGVAVGAVADMVIEPFGAMIIGSCAGIISTLGFQFLTPFLNRKKILHDTCGVNNLHGMPGVISGIISAIVAAAATRDNYYGDKLYDFYPSRIPVLNSTEYIDQKLADTKYAEGGLGRSALVQGGYQIAAVVLTLALAIVSGSITGLIMRIPILEQIEEDDLFDDSPHWIVPDDYDQVAADPKHENEKITASV